MNATGLTPEARSYKHTPFHKTLSFRLTILYAIFLAIVVVGFYTFLYRQHTHDTLRLIDDQLTANRTLVQRAGVEALRGTHAHWGRLLDGAGTLQAFSAGLAGLDGTPRDLPLPSDWQGTIGENQFETVSVPWHDAPIRLASFSVEGPTGRPMILQLATPLDFVEATLSRFTTAIVVAFPIVLAITIASGLSIAKKALAPIVEITQTARRITVENLNDRLSVSEVGDELDQLSETLNEMISRLEASFERIRRFTADASHELRTPLTAMRGETEMALRAPRTVDEYQEVLVSNLEEMERLSTIVADLLILSRSELRSDLRLESLDLGEMLTEICSHLEVLAIDKSITLRADALMSVELLGDRMRLMQLFSNLLDNAIKYTPEGGTVGLTLAQYSDRAVVKIADNGIGIAQEHLPHLFDRFFRVDISRARHDSSSGLGLSICRWIVESHNGKITVESTLGKGTVFAIALPLGHDESLNSH